MILFTLLFSFTAWSNSNLPPELATFLGPPPANFQKKYIKPAKDLKKALEHLAAGKKEQAAKELSALSKNNEMAEHATYALIQLHREKKSFAQSTALANNFLYQYPSSPYRQELQDIVDQNDCDQGLSEIKNKKNRTQGAELLWRCLQKTPWKAWVDKEIQVEALYDFYKSSKNPLLGPFVSELLQALPAATKMRTRIQKEISSTDLRVYAMGARFRSKTETPAGVKALYPDVDLFDQGMQAVLENRWSDANGLFKKMVADFPQSEHLDRAQYWIARSEESLGNKEEATKKYEEIYAQSPLTYYGLQSGLRLKKDLSLLVTPASITPESMQGTLLLGQAVALWRLYALLQEGLIDQARVEAKTLFQYRPGGFTFGQENASGAVLTALLYHTAGYSLAAFSHAYAAVSLDASQLNAFTLDLIFPYTFAKAFTAASEKSGVHPLLLLSVAKQESAFIPNAVSRSNALGLMQLLLSTARDMDPRLTPQQLFEPETNTEFGSRYLQKLLERYDGNIALALAGYNAGPTRASQWQKRMLEFASMKQAFDVDTFIDTIPFTETRRYVGSILRNYAWYKLLNKDGKIEKIEELAFQWQKNPEPEKPKSI